VNGILDESFIRSVVKPPGRAVWIHRPDTGQTAGVAIFLDAELYLHRVDARAVLDRLVGSSAIAPMTAVFVSSNGAAARHSDYTCDADYGVFLSQDVIPWVGDRYLGRGVGKVIIVGLSLSGLAAAHAAVTQPHNFHAAICQSPSFWWNDERFGSDPPLATPVAPALWVSVGDQEIERGVSHPPSGMWQAASQVDACQRGCDAFRAVGYSINHRVFSGGHDPACWADDLALALLWVASV
jgi:enterochelin esterase-like enzyme